MKKKLALGVSVGLLGAVLLITTAFANGNRGGKSFRAKLTGYEEIIPATATAGEGGAVSTTGRGKFTAQVRNGTIEYRLRYESLEGTASQAHIHFGQKHTLGGVSAFLCGGGDKPACTSPSGDISGTIDATDVIGPTGQGIEAGAITELIAAMRAGATYANVHTSKWGSGEIRGQINGRGKDKDD